MLGVSKNELLANRIYRPGLDTLKLVSNSSSIPKLTLALEVFGSKS
jgi:hypothetical protein